MSQRKLFDDWPEKYDQWFETPIGKLIREYESRLLLKLLQPKRNERILDAGCGTGVFTQDLASRCSNIIGLELSLPMLRRARAKIGARGFTTIQGDILNLPFKKEMFEKTISVTALEFVEDADGAVGELLRVTRSGGTIVVATLNALSTWATRRKDSAKKGHAIFQRAIFRSPNEMRDLLPLDCTIQTAVHFPKDEAPEDAGRIESDGRSSDLETGAFLAARWVKP
jgi:ubiquinone/menaquinone biosynthesis C-methylase UbiE